MSKSRGSVCDRPGSLHLKFHELETSSDGTTRVIPDEGCEQISTGKSLMHRLCPRVVRKFLSRWVSRGEPRAKASEDQQSRGATSEELSTLLSKVDELLKVVRRDEPCRSNIDRECIVCVNARAVLETYPCRHRVLCKSCFLKTIQVAISQGMLPLQCVLCRSEIHDLNKVPDLDLPMDFMLMPSSVRKAPRGTAKKRPRNYNQLGILRTPTSESEFFMEMLRHPDEPSLLGAPHRRRPRRPTFYQKTSSFSNALPRTSHTSVRSGPSMQRSRISPSAFSKTKKESRMDRTTPELLSPQEQFRIQFHQGKVDAFRERCRQKRPQE